MGITLRSMFFDDTDYSAEDFVESNKAFIKDGVIGTDSEQLKVVANTNMTVAIKSGRGWVQGHCFVNGSTASLTLSNADGTLNRIDRIVARLDYANHQISLIILTGTTASVPVPPALVRDGTYYDLCLATISVAKGTTAITDAMITDNRPDNTLCGWAGAYTSDTLNFALKADKTDVGDKNNLATTAKDNLVSAINEITSKTNEVGTTANKVYDVYPYANKVEFTSSGNWTCPANVKKVSIWMQNGGAGSGGAYAWSGASSNSEGKSAMAYSSDGASGSTGMVFNIDVVPGTVYPIVVGAGGANGLAPPTQTYAYAVCTDGSPGGISSAFGKTIATSNWYCLFTAKPNYTKDYGAYSNNTSNQTWLQTNIRNSKSGFDANICEKSLSSPPATNGGVGVCAYSNSYDKPSLVGNSGASGKVIIYY